MKTILKDSDIYYTGEWNLTIFENFVIKFQHFPSSLTFLLRYPDHQVLLKFLEAKHHISTLSSSNILHRVFGHFYEKVFTKQDAMCILLLEIFKNCIPIKLIRFSHFIFLSSKYSLIVITKSPQEFQFINTQKTVQFF